jgi:hypothetical protein
MKDGTTPHIKTIGKCGGRSNHYPDAIPQKKGSEPMAKQETKDRFTPDWADPDIPILKYRLPTNVMFTEMYAIQRVIDAILPYTVSQPVAVVVTRHPGEHTHWSFTGHPAHDTLQSRVETVTDAVANAVTGNRDTT